MLIVIGSHQRVADKALSVSVGGNVLTQVNSVQYLGCMRYKFNYNTLLLRI